MLVSNISRLPWVMQDIFSWSIIQTILIVKIISIACFFQSVVLRYIQKLSVWHGRVEKIQQQNQSNISRHILQLIIVVSAALQHKQDY